MRKLPTVLNMDEFQAILKHTTKKHHKLAFKLGFLCGLRVSEVVKLKPEDVDLGRNLLFIRQGKGNKDRYVPIPAPLRRDLKRLPVGCGVRALQIAFKKVVKKAGVEKEVSFHSLRHAGATYLIKKGWSTRQVQMLLGHSRVSTTEIYTHVSPDDLVEKMGEVWK